MRLTKIERYILATFVGIAQKVLDGTGAEAKEANGKQTRRSAAEVAKIKKQIQAARKKKVPVAQIAKELGVTTSYIYHLER